MDNRIKLATVNRDLANLEEDIGWDADARRDLDEATRLFESLHAEVSRLKPAEQKELRRSLGWLETRRGDALYDWGENSSARDAYRLAIDQLTPLAQDPKEWYWYKLFEAQARRGLGQIARDDGDSAEATRQFDEAIAIAREVAEGSRDPDPRDVLTRTLTLSAIPGSKASRREDAAGRMDEAVKLYDDLIREFPAVIWYRRDLAEAFVWRAELALERKRLESADRDLTGARETIDGLMAQTPENRSYPAMRGRLDLMTARLRRRQGKNDESARLLADAIDRLEHDLRDRPNRVAVRRALDAARREASASGPSSEAAR